MKRKEVPFLSNLTIYVDKKATASNKQYEVLSKAIEKHGGALVTKLHPTVDFAITNPSEQQQHLQKTKIRKLSWLQQCLSQNRLLEDEVSDITASSSARCDAVEDVAVKQDSQQLVVLPYACQRITTEAGNKNAHLTTPLTALEKYYRTIGDVNRQRAYRRTIAVLKSLERRLENAKQLAGIQYIGDKMVDKVDEILTTGTLRLLSQTQTEYAKSMELFTNIHGVGSSIANLWYKAGRRTIRDLEEAHDNGTLKPPLTRVQKLGLKYYSDSQVDVTPQDLSAIVATVRDALDQIDPALEFQVAGGMRRGKRAGHDVDLLIKNKQGGEDEVELLRQIEDKLQPIVLQSSDGKRRDSTDHHARCLGFFNIGHTRPLRRVDIIIIPEKEWGFALLGWTGSKHFEQSIRQFAKDKKGWSLNNHGFFDTNGHRLPIECTTEEQVFDVIGLPYRPPSERCC